MVNVNNVLFYLVESILSLNIYYNNMKMEGNKIKEFVFNKDFMFFFLYGFLGSNDLKLYSNGVIFDYFYFSFMIMDFILFFI